MTAGVRRTQTTTLRTVPSEKRRATFASKEGRDASFSARGRGGLRCHIRNQSNARSHRRRSHPKSHTRSKRKGERARGRPPAQSTIVRDAFSSRRKITRCMEARSRIYMHTAHASRGESPFAGFCHQSLRGRRRSVSGGKTPRAKLSRRERNFRSCQASLA